MKCNSCGAENGPAESSFICGYCGAENVVQSYFDEKSAEVMDASKNSSSIKQDGLRNYKIGDYEKAIESLIAHLKEDHSDAEAWIFLALSEAQTIKASNFLKRISSISDAMDNAKKYEKDKDLHHKSEIKLSGDLIMGSQQAANFFYRNSSKRFNSFGGGLDEAENCVTILEQALLFPNHGSKARIDALINGINFCSVYDSRYAGTFFDRGMSFLNQLEKLYEDENLKGTIDNSFGSNLFDTGRDFLKANSKVFAKSKPNTKSSKRTSDSDAEWDDDSKKGCLFIVIIILIIGWLFS